MVKKIYLTLLVINLLSINAFSGQPTMNLRSQWVDKTAMTRISLPDGTSSWVTSFPQSTMGTGTGQWFKMEVTGSYTTNQTWGYAATPAFNTSTTIPVNGGNGLISPATGKTYFFSIKDTTTSTNSVGFVFELGGTPVTISSATASTPTPGTSVTVTANLSGSLAANQTVWMRYSIGSSTYGTSTITQMTGGGTSYTATIPGQTVGTVVYYYCFTSGTISGGVTSSIVTQATINKSTSASYTVATSEVLNVTPSTLTGFSYFPGSGPSASQTYSLSGQYLDYPGNVTITSPTDYEISTDNGTTWGSSASISITSATLSATTIYVRLKAGLVQGNYNLENITNAGGGATTVNVACSGTVLKFAPPNQSTGFTASIGSPSSTVIHFAWTDDAIGSPTPDGYLIRGSSVGYSSITPPVNGIPVASSGLDMNVAQGTQVANITGLSQGTTYYFYIYSYTNSGTNILYNLVGPQQSSATTTVTTYYSKSTGNLDVLSNWGASIDGTGNAPANFTTDGITFIIANNPAPTIGSTWTVSGATSKIQVGDGTAAINFSVPSTLTATNLDIMNNATLTLGSAITLTGTINVKTGGTLNCGTYTVSGTNGIFNLLSGGKLMIGSPLGITTTGTASGNIQTTGTRTYNSAGKYVYNGTASQVTGNALPGTLATGGLLQISNIASTVTLSQYTDIASGVSCIVDAGATLTTGSNTHHFDPGCLVTINGTFQIDASGGTYASGTNACFTYGTNGTFSTNSSSVINLYNNNSAWNNNTGYVATPPNVNVKGTGGISLQTSSTLNVSGTFQTSGPVAISSGALNLNGTCQINTGGSFTNAPTYGANSTLIYYQGGSRTRGNEWLAVTTGAGYPKHVQISNSTTLGMSTTAAQCAGNLTIDALSTLTTTSNTLTVLGNVLVNGTISLAGNVSVSGNWTVAGSQTTNSKIITFGGSSLQTITGPAAFDNLIINNASGVSLASACTVNSNLTLTNGLLTTTIANLITLGAAATVSGGSTASFVNGPISLTASAGTTLMAPVGKGIAYRPVWSHIYSLTGSGTLTIEQIENPPIGTVTAVPTPVLSNIRYFHVTESGLAGGIVDLTLSWGADDGILDSSTVTVVGGNNGGNWAWANNKGAEIGYANTVTTSSFDPSSYFLGDCTLGSYSGNPMPVNLTSFSALLSNGTMKLSWKTSVETDNYGFDIERSTDKSLWAKLLFIQGQGNSNTAKAYSYSDNSINKVGKYYYRLKQIDNNGSYKYSNVIEADYIAPTVYSLNQNYPNPFNPNTVITYALPVASNVKISVYNAIGETVQILENGFKSAGNYSVLFNAAGIPSGVYFYRIEAGNFLQVRKMMYLK